MEDEVFKKKKAGIFGVVAFSIFITIIVVTIGMFVYKRILKSEISNLKSELAEKQATIDQKSIKEMLSFNRKLKAVKSLVDKHKIVSSVFSTISSSTVSTVQFTDFGYRYNTDNDIEVSMHGKAVDYASVALQEDVLVKTKSIKSVSFSNLGLSDKGTVSFGLVVVISPEIGIYSPRIVQDNPSNNNKISSSTAVSSIDDLSDLDNFYDLSVPNFDNL